MTKAIIFFLFVVSTFLYAESGFFMKTELVAPGTRSEGKRHILYYNDIAIPPEVMNIYTQNGKKYFYKEAEYTWSDAGWMEKSCTVPKSLDSIEIITKEELIAGHYYSKYDAIKKNTPKNWVFIDNKLYNLWIAPDKIAEFLGISDKKAVEYVFLGTRKHPKMVWHKNFFTRLILKDDLDFFIVLGIEREKQQPMLYKISKKTGDIISKYPWTLKTDLGVLSPSVTLSNGYLYSLTKSLNNGRFIVTDMKNGKSLYSEKVYFTHKAPIKIHDHNIYLAYSEADHKFCHLMVFNDKGKKLWHFRSKESIVTLSPLISKDRIIFFTNSMIYCLEQ